MQENNNTRAIWWTSVVIVVFIATVGLVLYHNMYKADFRSYETVTQEVKSDLLEHYDITGVDIPVVQEIVDKVDESVTGYSKMLRSRAANDAKGEWLENLHTDGGSPATVRIRTQDFELYTYEVSSGDEHYQLNR